MNGSRLVLPTLSGAAIVFGLVSAWVAFAVPPKTGGIGVEPLIIGVVCIVAGLIGLIIFARHRSR
jgi:hypothetical protein